MSVQVENLEKNMVKLTIEVAEDKVAEALKAAYNKQKNKISIPGFRKGKVPMAMVEKMYGPEIFYEDAANIMMQDRKKKLQSFPEPLSAHAAKDFCEFPMHIHWKR